MHYYKEVNGVIEWWKYNSMNIVTSASMTNPYLHIYTLCVGSPLAGHLSMAHSPKVFPNTFPPSTVVHMD